MDVDRRWRDLPEGARLTLTPPEPAARALVPHPDLTVALAEIGFVVSPVAGQLEARKTTTAIRRYRSGDEVAIRDLFRRAFAHELTPEKWQWRYRDHPLGGPCVTVAIAANGELVGHYGGYPAALRHPSHSSRLLAHQNGDVMTGVGVRRLGHGPASIVSRMAQHFWAAYGEGRADVHYGFNTGTARDLQRRVVPGVRALEPVLTWTAAQLPAVPAPAAPARVERITRFDAEWDAFVDRVAGQYGLLAGREARLLNWRYLDEPSADSIALVARAAGRIVGGSVFRVAGGETRWGEALFDRDQPDAPAQLLQYVRALGTPPAVHAWFSARPGWWARTLETLGFRAAPEPRGLTVVYAPFTEAAERLMPEWYYSWGDSDLF